MASFVLSFFPLDVLDEIWDLIESVSEGFLTYSYVVKSPTSKCSLEKLSKEYDSKNMEAEAIILICNIQSRPHTYCCKFS